MNEIVQYSLFKFPMIITWPIIEIANIPQYAIYSRLLTIYDPK